MKKIYFFVFLVWLGFFTLSITSLQSQAACEADLLGYHVQYPQGGGSPGSEVFQLNNGYIQMMIGVAEGDRSNPWLKPQYDMLYDAALQNLPVSFGVDLRICSLLSQYQLPIGFGGSYSILPLKRITAIHLGEQLRANEWK